MNRSDVEKRGERSQNRSWYQTMNKRILILCVFLLAPGLVQPANNRTVSELLSLADSLAAAADFNAAIDIELQALEIAERDGSAAARLGVGVGAPVHGWEPGAVDPLAIEEGAAGVRP